MGALREAYDAFDEPLQGLKAANKKATELGLYSTNPKRPSDLKRPLHVATPAEGKVLLYEALALKDGNVQALPVKIHGRTLAHERLGADNLLRVKFEGPDMDDAAKRHQRAVLTGGLSLAGRAYRLYCQKDDLVWFVAVGGLWQTAEAARSSLADFAACKSIQKFATRPALALSQTFSVDCALRSDGIVRLEVQKHGDLKYDVLVRTLREPPEDVLQIVEVADALARDESGQPVLDGKGEPIPMEDGCGLVSADVAARIPRVANGAQTDEAGCDGGGPLVTQVRLWYQGSLAKGTLLRCAALPPRTIVVRRTQVKVDGQPGCAAADFWAVEVCQTAERALPCRSTVQLVPLLEALGGQVAVGRLLQLAEKERQRVLELGENPDPRLLKALCAKSYPSEREERQGGAEREPIEINMLQAGFSPRDEPNLAKGIANLMSDRIKRLRLGSFTIDESTHVMGVADPTGSLRPGTVCVVRKGEFMCAHKDVLLYRSPGQHPGDVRKVRLVPPPDELQRALGPLSKRDSAIIFPTVGSRSLADEMAGGDLDGDTFSVIWDAELVQAVQCVPALTEAASTTANHDPPALDVNELQREKHHAAKVHQQRQNRHLAGVAANEWLKVAETQGAGSADARSLACIYYTALDAGKSGQKVPEIARRLTTQLPPHLKDHKCGKTIVSFARKPGTTMLARLHSMEAAPSSSQSARAICELLNYESMIPPEFRPGGPRFQEQLEFDATWTQLHKEYNKECSSVLAADKWDGYEECIERYRQKLLEGEDEWINPPLNSTLLAKAAAIYCVVYKHQKEWGGDRYAFAWRVAGDYLCYLKASLDEHAHQEQTGRKRCVLPASRPATKAMFAPKSRSAPASESQEY